MGKKKLELKKKILNKILLDGNNWILKSGIQINSDPGATIIGVTNATGVE